MASNSRSSERTIALLLRNAKVQNHSLGSRIDREVMPKFSLVVATQPPSSHSCKECVSTVNTPYVPSCDLVWSGNTFTGTTELQFFDAQATIWSGNTIPSGACLDIVDEDDGEVIPLSTFAEQSGLPGSC